MSTQDIARNATKAAVQELKSDIDRLKQLMAKLSLPIDAWKKTACEP
jgi:hypothetical protein